MNTQRIKSQGKVLSDEDHTLLRNRNVSAVWVMRVRGACRCGEQEGAMEKGDIRKEDL